MVPCIGAGTATVPSGASLSGARDAVSAFALPKARTASGSTLSTRAPAWRADDAADAGGVAPSK